MTKPVDDVLLEPLGRVQQSAASLHRGVREAVDQLTGQRGDIQLDGAGLCEAIRHLESEARKLPASKRRTELLDWIHHQAMPAADQRARVTNARVVVAADGTQCLHGHAGEEFDVDDLLAVAERLNRASRCLPPGTDGT